MINNHYQNDTDFKKSFQDSVNRCWTSRAKSPSEIQKALNYQHPLVSRRTFLNLNLSVDVLRALHRLEYGRPTKIQEKILPLILNYSPINYAIHSEPGTGKSALVSIAVLKRIDKFAHYPQVLILSPTIESAAQSKQTLERIGMFCPGKTTKLAIGGQPFKPQEKIRDQVVVGTAGTVCEWAIDKQHIDLWNVDLMIVDEYDIVFGNASSALMCHRIMSELSPICQKILISSLSTDHTFNWLDSTYGPFRMFRPINMLNEIPNNIQKFNVISQNEQDKFERVIWICHKLTEKKQRAIIFVQNAKRAKHLTEKLLKNNINVSTIHGKLNTSERVSTLAQLMTGGIKIIVTTNILARGVDIANVSVVISYDPPVNKNGTTDENVLCMRSTRTGRFGRDGVFVNFF